MTNNDTCSLNKKCFKRWQTWQQLFTWIVGAIWCWDVCFVEFITPIHLHENYYSFLLLNPLLFKWFVEYYCDFLKFSRENVRKRDMRSSISSNCEQSGFGNGRILSVYLCSYMNDLENEWKISPASHVLHQNHKLFHDVIRFFRLSSSVFLYHLCRYIF